MVSSYGLGFIITNKTIPCLVILLETKRNSIVYVLGPCDSCRKRFSRTFSGASTLWFFTSYSGKKTVCCYYRTMIRLLQTIFQPFQKTEMSNSCVVRAEYLRTILYKQASHPWYDLSRIFLILSRIKVFSFSLKEKFQRLISLQERESYKVYNCSRNEMICANSFKLKRISFHNT